MKLLLDTHLLLWVAGHPQKISNVARLLIEAPENELFFSAASIWEIAIKNNLGREDFQVNSRILRRELIDNDYNDLSISSEHTLAIDTLPNIHRDPFDRILIAQSMVEGITLLTTDNIVAQYPGPIRMV